MCDNSYASFFLVQVYIYTCMFVAATDHISLYMEFFPFRLLLVLPSPPKKCYLKRACVVKKVYSKHSWCNTYIQRLQRELNLFFAKTFFLLLLSRVGSWFIQMIIEGVRGRYTSVSRPSKTSFHEDLARFIIPCYPPMPICCLFVSDIITY